MKWAGYVADMGQMRNVYKIVVKISKGKRPFVDIGIDRKIILRWRLRN
jgi:hypothetical protein